MRARRIRRKRLINRRGKLANHIFGYRTMELRNLDYDLLAYTFRFRYNDIFYNEEHNNLVVTRNTSTHEDWLRCSPFNLISPRLYDNMIDILNTEDNLIVVIDADCNGLTTEAVCIAKYENPASLLDCTVDYIEAICYREYMNAKHIGKDFDIRRV